ncbi:pentatricopeptide repeat-containing protein At1g06140, mitochondrial-like [Wolffia australiana]
MASRSWNYIISKAVESSEIWRLYAAMKRSGGRPDGYNLVFASRACEGTKNVKIMKSVHCDAVRSGLDAQEQVAVAVLKAYARLGFLDEALRLCRLDLDGRSILWGLAMKYLLENSRNSEAVGLFSEMNRIGAAPADPSAAVHAAQALGKLAGGGSVGAALHGLCVKNGVLHSNARLQTSLVDMYSRSAMAAAAEKLFGEMAAKDVVAWSLMVTRLVRSGRPADALEALRRTAAPNEVTIAGGLHACAQLGALLHGRSLHGCAIRREIKLDLVSSTCLLDMYAKLGAISEAQKVFDGMPRRNVYAWSAMIGGLGFQGRCSEALSLFSKMKESKLQPNAVTFVAVLSACSHGGDVEQARRVWQSMSRDFGVAPAEEHCACMVDLLGRAGLLDEAAALILTMAAPPGAAAWGALLAACRLHRRVEMAEMAAEKLHLLEPDCPGALLLLSDVYAAAGKADMAEKTRAEILQQRLRKTVGVSSVEVRQRQ